MPANNVVLTEFDPAITEEAASVLAPLGLTVSDACRMLLTRIAHDKRLPFDDEIPNALTQQTLEHVERGENLHRANNPDDLFRQLCI